jgi:hypothetical protein
MTNFSRDAGTQGHYHEQPDGPPFCLDQQVLVHIDHLGPKKWDLSRKKKVYRGSHFFGSMCAM